jgi:hypothetical protein
MANSIQEALAAVQRKINEQRMKNSESNHNAIQEAVPLPTNRPVPRPAVPTVRPNSASAPGSTSAASSGDESNSSYWNQEAARNKAAGNKPLPNEFNLFGGNKPAASSAPAPSSRPSQTPRPAVSDPKVLQQQKDLISKGYNIKADGIMGPKTAAAAKDFGSAASRDDQEQGAAMRAAATKSNASDALKKAQERSAGTDENGNMLPPTRSAAPAPAPAPAPASTSGRSASGSVSATPAPRQETPAPAAAAPAPVSSGVTPPSAAETERQRNLNAVPTVPSIGSRISDAASSLMDKTKSLLPSKDDMKDVPESGPSKGKKKMSESTIIDAFLKLQETKAGNVFEAAKKMNGLCPKCKKAKCICESWKEETELDEKLVGNQKKIDKNHNGELDKQDFQMLRGKKMEEEAEELDEISKETAKSYINKTWHRKGENGEELSDRKKMNREYGISRARRIINANEETDPGFSEAELAHFEAVIARKDQKGKERGIGDTVDSADLTDEYIYEMARKPGETRGRKKGTKIDGGYKNTKTKRGGVERSETDLPDEGPRDVQHVLHQIRHNPEDEHGFKTISHPASSPEAPVTKRIHRSELHGFYDAYHDTEKPREKEKAYGDFLGKQFGDSRATKVSLGGSKLVGGKN